MNFSEWSKKKKEQNNTAEVQTNAPSALSSYEEKPSSFAEWTRKKAGETNWKDSENPIKAISVKTNKVEDSNASGPNNIDNSVSRTSDAVQYDIDEWQSKYNDKQREVSELFANLSARNGGSVESYKKLSEDYQAQKKELDSIKETLDGYKSEKETLDQAEYEDMLANGYREASWGDVLIKGIKQGVLNSQYGKATYEDMMSNGSNVAEQYKKQFESDEYKFTTNSKLKSAMLGVANQLGQQIYQWTDPRSVAAGAAAAGAVALAGQAGPQLLVPEEVITVPGAFVAGIQAGSTVSNFEIEAGFAYNEMIDNGISEDTAKAIANVVGLGNAALEFVQLDELAKSFKVLKSTGATKSTAKLIGEELLRRGLDVANETVQEVAQESVTIAGAQAASKIETGDWAYSKEEVGERLGETGVSSAITFGIMNVPGGAHNVISVTRDGQTTTMDTQDVESVLEEAGLSKSDAKEIAPEIIENEYTTTDADIVSEQLASPSDELNMAQSTTIPTTQNVVSEAKIEAPKVTATKTLDIMAPALGENGSKALRASYDGSIDTAEFAKEFTKVYNASRNNETVPATSKISTEQRMAAIFAGENDAKLARKLEDTNNVGHEVHLYESGQRNDSTYSGGQISGMEEAPGRNQVWETLSQSRDREAVNLTLGGEVSLASIIEGGSTEQTVRLVTGGETKATAQAIRIAKQEGLDLVLYASDDYLHVGNVSDAQAYIDTSSKKAYVRVNDPDFTAAQLIIHEKGHDLIAQGKVNLSEVRKNAIAATNGRVEQLAQAYAEAYDGLSVDEAWEELVCDSLARMNRFEGVSRVLETTAAEDMSAVRQATRYSEQQPRAPDNNEAMSRKGRFYNFPTYDESGSEANQIATRWAHNSATDVDAQKLVSYHDKWYLIEKFDSNGWGYQIVRSLTAKQYKEYVKERNENGEKQSLQNSSEQIDNLDRRRGSIGGTRPGTTSNAARYGREGQQVQRVDKNKDEWQLSSNDSSRDNEPVSKDKQGIENFPKVQNKFSRKGDFEQTRTMIAWHNMNADALESALDLGGLAMPSFAVKPSDSVHDTYGNISIIARKESIAPNKDQSIYGGDAWTPVFPAVHHKVSYEKSVEMANKVKAILEKAGASYSDMGVHLDASNIADKLDRARGSFVDNYEHEYGLKLAFLEDTGRSISVPKKDKAYSVDAAALKVLAKKFGDIWPGENIMQYEPEIRKYMHDYTLRTYKQDVMRNGRKFNEIMAERLYGEKLSFVEVDDILKDAHYVKQNGVVKTVDRTKLDKRIDNAMKTRAVQNEYKAWLKDLSDGVVEKLGIRNDRDMFTPRGERRSFDQLHYDYSLANIVRAMKGEARQGRVQFMSGVGSLKGAALKSYNSIEEVRADLNRIVNGETEESKIAYEEFNAHAQDISKYISPDDWLNGADIIADILGHSHTESGIRSYLNREYKFFETQDHLDLDKIAHDIYTLGQEANTLPMEYFESKLYRAFTFDEAAAVVVPSNIDKNLITRLEEQGANVVKYKAGDEADRLRKVNGVKDAKFSRKGDFDNLGETLDSEQAKLTDNLNPTENPDIRYSRGVESMTELREENAALKEKLKQFNSLEKRAENAERQLTKTEKPTLRKDDVAKFAKSLVSNFNSDVNLVEITKKVQALGDYIVQDGDNGVLAYEDVKDRAIDIAREIVENASELSNADSIEVIRSIRNYLRGNKFYFDNMRGFNESVPGYLKNDKEYRKGKGEIADYKHFHAKNLGRFTLTTDKNATQIDDAWSELQGMYGTELFPEEINTVPDMVLHISDLLDNIEPVYTNPYDYDMASVIEWQANRIVDGLIDESVRQTAPTYADKMERKLAKQKYQDARKYNEALKRVRDKRDADIKKIKQHYKDIAETKKLRREDSASRTRLLKIAKRLNNKKLPAASRALINEYIGELDLVSKSITGKTIGKLMDLREWYEDQAETNPDFIPDAGVEKALQRLSKRQISDLSQDEVSELTNILLNIENEIRTQNKLINSEDKRDTFFMGEQVINDINNSGGKEGLGYKIDRAIISGTLSPVREMHRVTGYVENDPLYVLTNKLADGQREMFDYQRRAGEKFLKWTEDKKFVEQIAGKKAKEISITGIGSNGPTTVKITPAMRMSLYLHRKNAQNMTHIAGGGITVPDIKLYKNGDIAEAYARGITIKLTPSEVDKICLDMSDKERAFAMAAHDYFNGMSQESINKTSEYIKGYSLATVEDYFPINTDRSFLKSEFEALKFDGTIEGMGFLKERVNSAAPIMLRDLNSVLSQSIDQTAKYVGLAIPVRNFNKVWGVTKSSFAEDGTRTDYTSSVQQAIKNKWGETGYKYVEKMMSDINGGRASDEGIWSKALSKIRSNYAGAVLTLNASVAMKQAASYPTAGSVLGFKPLARAMADFGKVDLDIINKYTPLLWYRTQGFSTQELGDMAKQSKSLPKVLNWVQGVDVLTTRKLWKASEYYVRMNNKDLNVGTDAYYKAVADIYNRVIEETQPNYTTMQRPDLLRSNDSLTQSMMMFKTQPFQNFNILYDSFGNLEAKKNAYINLGTDEAKQEYRNAKKDAWNATWSQLMQLAVFAGMTFAWNMFRGKTEDYEDEEGNVTIGSALEQIGKDMLGSQAGSIPFGAEVWEVLNSVIYGDTYYGFDNITASSLDDMANAFIKAGKNIESLRSSIQEGKEVDWKSQANKWSSVIDAVGNATGVPIANVEKLFKAVFLQSAKAASGDYYGEYVYLRYTVGSNSEYYELLWKAKQKDLEAYEKIYSDMVGSGDFEESKIRSAMENKMKKAEGVSSVDELSQRYLNPTQQESYDKMLSEVKKSSVWRQATDEQRGGLEDNLYTLLVETTSENSAGTKMQSKIEGGESVGLTDVEYLLYQLALKMVDEPNKNGNYGTYTNEEKKAAADKVGLSEEEYEYLK